MNNKIIKTSNICVELNIDKTIDNILNFSERVNKDNKSDINILETIVNISNTFNATIMIGGKKYDCTKNDLNKMIQCFEVIEMSEFSTLIKELLLYITEIGIIIRNDLEKNTSDLDIFSNITSVNVNVVDFLSEKTLIEILGKAYTQEIKNILSNFDLSQLLERYDPITLADLNKDLITKKIGIKEYRELIFLNTKGKISKYILDVRRNENLKVDPETGETSDNSNDPNKQFAGDTTNLGSGFIENFNPGHVQDSKELSPEEKLKMDVYKQRQKNLLKNPEYVDKYLRKDFNRKIV